MDDFENTRVKKIGGANLKPLKVDYISDGLIIISDKGLEEKVSLSFPISCYDER